MTNYRIAANLRGRLLRLARKKHRAHKLKIRAVFIAKVIIIFHVDHYCVTPLIRTALRQAPEFSKLQIHTAGKELSSKSCLTRWQIWK
jgi:hypothetical protein